MSNAVFVGTMVGRSATLIELRQGNHLGMQKNHRGWFTILPNALNRKAVLLMPLLALLALFVTWKYAESNAFGCFKAMRWRQLLLEKPQHKSGHREGPSRSSSSSSSSSSNQSEVTGRDIKGSDGPARAFLRSTKQTEEGRVATRPITIIASTSDMPLDIATTAEAYCATEALTVHSAMLTTVDSRRARSIDSGIGTTTKQGSRTINPLVASPSASRRTQTGSASTTCVTITDTKEAQEASHLKAPMPHASATGVAVEANAGRCKQGGPSQSHRIISCSLFGNLKRYIPMVGKMSRELLSLDVYKSWRLRVYHDNELDDDVIRRISADCGNVDFCNIERLPHYGNLSSLHHSTWRFLAVGDPTVDVFNSRDLDSTIMQRDADAVEEWLASERTAHIMRDNPAHGGKILAGMWGFKNAADRTTANRIESLLLTYAVNSTLDAFWGDQQFLAKRVWPVIHTNAVMHDSYTCRGFPGSQPFPSRRRNGTWIGCKDWHNNCRRPIKRHCPVECRPKEHQDWLQC